MTLGTSIQRSIAKAFRSDPMSRSVFVSLFLLLNLVLGVAFLSWNRAEYTDSVRYLLLLRPTALELRSYGIQTYPPGYSLTIEMLRLVIEDGETAARVVSVLATAITCIPLSALAARFFGGPVAGLALLFYTTCPMVRRWSIRVNSDALFLFLFISTLCLLDHARRNPSSVRFGVALFSAGLATSVRYHGLSLVALWLLAIFPSRLRPRRVINALWGAAPLAALIVWLGLRGGGYFSYFAMGVRGGESFGKLFLYAEGYFWGIVYVLTPFLAAALLYALFRVQAGDRWLFFGPLGVLTLVWLVVHVLSVDFELRYFLPLMPLFLSVAAAGICAMPTPWRTIFVIFSLLSGLALTTATLTLQRDTWGDLRAAADFVRRSAVQQRVFVYPELLRPVLWSGREDLAALDPERLQAGDWIWVHSNYMDHTGGQLMVLVGERFRLQPVFESSARWMPILPDHVADGSERPDWLLSRFTWQQSRCTIYRLIPRPVPGGVGGNA